MKKKYLIHYLLQNKEDQFKHIHQSVEVYKDGYIESLLDARLAVKLVMSKTLEDQFYVTIVSWQRI